MLRPHSSSPSAGLIMRPNNPKGVVVSGTVGSNSSTNGGLLPALATMNAFAVTAGTPFRQQFQATGAAGLSLTSPRSYVPLNTPKRLPCGLVDLFGLRGDTDEQMRLSQSPVSAGW